MSRYFNNQEVELLAPVGTFEIFKQVIHSGADAVYLGGKIFNMRMHRKGFNFTDEELAEAVKITRDLGKKIYITVNNLLSSEDLKQAKDYLTYLSELKPDAIIVQDMSIVYLVNELGLDLNIHASVMMNTHNLETIKALRELGVTRVVTSRDIDLETVKYFSRQTDMEFEYFVHGDMCVAHGSQCTYSGILFGKSGNRGLCMKPCRWGYKMNQGGNQYNTTFPLAVKDMYMYENIPELIEAGVVSFKIEGRMREADYLLGIINSYSDAINRYIEDPIFYDRQKDSKTLYENRKRDFSTAYAFGKPGLSNINERWEGTGKFYSTGKVFSKPVEESEMKDSRVQQIKSMLATEDIKTHRPTLSVKVNSYQAAMMAIEEGVEKIYLSGEVFQPQLPFSVKEIQSLSKNKGNSKLYLGLPTMMYEDDFSRYAHLLRTQNLGIDGIVVTNLGAIRYFADFGFEMIGDTALNIYNATAANFYGRFGLSLAGMSNESPVMNTKDLLQHSALPIEITVHGAPVVMYMSHDLYENTKIVEASQKADRKYRDKEVLLLIDDKGQEHPVYRDNKGNNHMVLAKELCYLPLLKELHHLGAASFKIEGCNYELETLRQIINTYQKAIANLELCDELVKELNYENLGFTLGAMQYN